MTPIAIVGLSGIFPDATNVAQFWDNTVQKRNCIREVPASRWRLEDYYDPDPAAPDKTYSRVGGFMPDVDFDPVEFGIPPAVLEVTDVAQLLALVLARDAFADAGYGVDSDKELPRARTGVILGIGGGQKLITPLTSRLQSPVWEEAMRSSGISPEDAQAISAKARQAYVPWEENSFPGLLGNVIAGRIANRFDLGGINCVVDAACASSLAAVRMAISELAEGQCDVMLTGGIDTDNTVFMYLCFSKTPAFSKQGAIRPFDGGADGMLIGEAAGLLVLKRLEDAERDGDRVYAVIRGIGSSSDGRFSSIYAPRSEGQAMALERAYANAGFAPQTVSLIEAHGTGTVAGDLVEIGTLDRVFGREVQAQVALGSAKSQVGHGKAAAGAVGLIRSALALHHKVLPPTINVSTPHPAGDFGRSAFYLNSETRPWFRPDPETPRRAGVSSFGFGGSNYHAVLEEHRVEPGQTYRLHGHARPFLFAASTPAGLAASVQQTATALEAQPERFDALAAEAASRSPEPPDARLGFVAGSAAEAAELLALATQQLRHLPDAEGWDHPRGIFYRGAVADPRGGVVALFPGQGAQYVDMGRELAANFPEVREAFEAFDVLFQHDGGRLSDVVFPPPKFDSAHVRQDEERLRSTDRAQPAIGALSAGLFRLLERFGFEADFAAGHSFGELTALWAAGALTDDTFRTLARARGKAMAPPPEPGFDPGAMLSVPAGVDTLEPLLADLPGVSLANVNSPKQSVLAGPTEAIALAERLLMERGLASVRLPVAAAFHTSLVAHARDVFAGAVDTAKMRRARLRVFANASGAAYPSRSREMARTLVDQMLAPVNFLAEIENLYAAGGRLFVEIGPRRILTDLVQDILGSRPFETVALNPSRRGSADHQFREALVKLRVLGLPVQLTDPYDRTLRTPRRPLSPAAVKLNGANYVSPQTRQAYQAALNNGHRVQAASASPGPAPLPPVSTPAGEGAAMLAQAQLLAAEAHQQFLRDQGQQNRLLLSLLQGPAGTDPSLRERFEAFERLQTDTQRTHELFLEQQTELLRAYTGEAPRTALLAEAATTGGRDVQASTAPAAAASAAWSSAVRDRAADAPAPAALAPGDTSQSAAPAFRSAPLAQNAAGHGEGTPSAAQPAEPASAPTGTPGGMRVEAVHEVLLELVSERTGYPRDVLDLNMDLEADLGVDSIKRVEILGALRDRFPNAPQPEPAELGELRTLAHIAAYLARPASEAQPGEPPIRATPPVLQEAIAPTPSQSAHIAESLLELVSERTGYPRDVLDLAMDIEADLGIDSIKRVEILGALRDRFPDLPQPAPGELGELRTLESVVRYLHGHGTGSAVVTPEPPLSANKLPVTGVRLHTLPPPDTLEGALPAGVCLVTDDGTARTTAVAEALREAGARVAILELPPNVLPSPRRTAGDAPATAGAPIRSTADDGPAGALGPVPERRLGGPVAEVPRIALPELSEELLADVCRSAAGFIYLHPRTHADGWFPEWEHEAAKLVFLLAKHLAGPLAEAVASDSGRPFFCTVSSLDGALGLNGEYDAGAISGGLPGLVKSLRLEWPGVYCRALDLSPELGDEEAARAILRELRDPDTGLAEVAVGPHGRATLVAAS